MEKRTIKSILLCITYALVMLFVLLNFSSVWGILSNFVAIIMPFVYGFAIAYILKFLYEFFRQKAFAKMMKGKTSFVVAHRLSTIKECDVILVMKDGNIIEQGNHEELLKQNGFYTNLYNSQFSNT